MERLEETATFTVAWLPGPFISAEVMDRALERVRCALASGGWLIFGFSIPYQTLRSSTHLRVCGLCAAAAIPGLQRRSKISSGRSFSSKLKSTHPRRRSRWWSRNGQSKASDSELNEDKEMTRSATQSRFRPGSALPGPRYSPSLSGAWPCRASAANPQTMREHRDHPRGDRPRKRGLTGEF